MGVGYSFCFWDERRIINPGVWSMYSPDVIYHIPLASLFEWMLTDWTLPPQPNMLVYQCMPSNIIGLSEWAISTDFTHERGSPHPLLLHLFAPFVSLLTALTFFTCLHHV